MTEPTRIILACDESGAKGYADQPEQYPGEVGVFAGFLIPEDKLDEKLPPFQALIPKYTPPGGKLHIADLTPEQQEALRQDVYEVIRNSGLPCFWYAIHVAGFHNWHKIEETLKQDARAATDNSTVKRGSARPDPSSLHTALFTGLYGHLIAFLEERGKVDVEIEVRSDQIDPPIIEEFEKAALRLLSTAPNVTPATGFDTATKKVLHGRVSIQAHYPPELAIKMAVRSLCLNPIPAGDGLVLAADVLANSLNYLFKHRPADELFRPLNTPAAVATHPLAKHLDAFNNWGEGDLLGDRLYRHPNAPADNF